MLAEHNLKISEKCQNMKYENVFMNTNVTYMKNRQQNFLKLLDAVGGFPGLWLFSFSRTTFVCARKIIQMLAYVILLRLPSVTDVTHLMII